ncbi:hypothetical protein A5787_23495 [Mycobacterium sp. 852002-50816_SCH5313054-b]|nr:hypothetical protein A5787_23495 [Mycobacterium sp. 852002-50816_SCH5313054-b]
MDVVIDIYPPRSHAARFVVEPTDRGPELPDELLHGLHRAGDTFLKAPEDAVPVLPSAPRHARRGELDIILDFEFDGDSLPTALEEALRDTAYEIMALLNIHLRDFLTPALPFQIRKLMDDGKAGVKFIRRIAVEDRQELTVDALGRLLTEVASVLAGPINTEKFRTALELYAAHFNERQPRVRIILLVIAMEALAVASPKDQAALDLIDRWTAELNEEKAKHGKASSVQRSLDSLGGQLNSLRNKSIGAQIGDLFADIPGLSEDGLADLRSRAKDVYNKRSKLVHDGYLSPSDLPGLEKEARTLVEMLFRGAIARSEPPEGMRLVISEPQTGA